MKEIKKLYTNRYSDYHHAEEVKRVADVSERQYAIFLLILPPDSYSISGAIYDETRSLFKKASLDVVNKITKKHVFDSDLWKQVLITNEDYGKRFFKLMLSEK